MALYLVQHGKSFPEDEDPERSLTPEGISDVQRIANLARDYGIRVQWIEHSDLKRARQTAEIFAAALKPDGGIRQREGLRPKDDAAAVARQIPADQDLMLVGHLPFMAHLTSQLVAGTTEHAIFRFQTGGVLCLVSEPGGAPCVIKWALLPSID